MCVVAIFVSCCAPMAAFGAAALLSYTPCRKACLVYQVPARAYMKRNMFVHVSMCTFECVHIHSVRKSAWWLERSVAKHTRSCASMCTPVVCVRVCVYVGVDVGVGGLGWMQHPWQGH